MRSAAEERQWEIQNKLEKEEANYGLLNDRLNKSSQIATGIDTILNTFEKRLLRLEDTILPVYNETENLQRTQNNIERTLQLLDNVIGYYNVSSEVETVIERGPNSETGGIPLPDYLLALNRLRRAQQYFEQHIPQSVELENVTSLFHKGSDKLNTEFKSILDRYNTPTMAVTLLDLIGGGGGADFTQVDSAKSPPPIATTLPITVPEVNRKQLSVIAVWLLENNRDEHLTVYGKVRGAVLQRSLMLLRNHQKSVSGGGGGGAANNTSVGGGNATMTGGATSPVPRAKQQTRHEAMRRPSTRRLHQAFERKGRQMLQTLEHSTGLNLGSRRTSSTFLESSYTGDEVDSEQEMENYLICIIALHKLMQIEQVLIKDIIALTHQPRVFELIVREAMDTIVQDGENIVARAKKCINRHDFTAVLVIFPILKQLRCLRPEFERTVEHCDLNVKAKFDTILTMLHSTGARALEDFIESLRSEAVAQLPSDGTVHELTSNVIMFLEQLLEYSDIIGIVLAQDASYIRHLDRLKSQHDSNKLLLGLYIKKVLVQLNHTLLNKSEQYSDVALKAIFRLNNNNYVLKSLQRSSLLELYTLLEPNCENYYHNSIKEHKNAYSHSWSKLLNYISCDDIYFTSSSLMMNDNSKLREKDRAGIKEKFSGFNREIEEIGRVQRGYSIPDVELRESIKRDNKELIIPRYNQFYNTYADVQFTKNPEKYIKHKPEEVSAIIDRLFDVAA